MLTRKYKGNLRAHCALPLGLTGVCDQHEPHPVADHCTPVGSAVGVCFAETRAGVCDECLLMITPRFSLLFHCANQSADQIRSRVGFVAQVSSSSGAAQTTLHRLASLNNSPNLNSQIWVATDQQMTRPFHASIDWPQSKTPPASSKWHEYRFSCPREIGV